MASSMCVKRPVYPNTQTNIKAPLYWTLCGKPSVTGGFPSEMASHAEIVSMPWCQHDSGRQHSLPVFINKQIKYAQLAHVKSIFLSLSWRVQHIVVIGRVYSKLEHSDFSSNFEFDRNMLSGTGACSSSMTTCGAKPPFTNQSPMWKVVSSL